MTVADEGEPKAESMLFFRVPVMPELYRLLDPPKTDESGPNRFDCSGYMDKYVKPDNIDFGRGIEEGWWDDPPRTLPPGRK